MKKIGKELRKIKEGVIGTEVYVINEVTSV
jgi:hypothetical protein